MGVAYDESVRMYKQDYVPNYFGAGMGWERKVNLSYFDEKHVLKSCQNVGIRVHGQGSRKYNQKSFSLYAREEYGDQSVFEYDLLGNGMEYNKLVLRTGDTWYTMMRELLVYELIKDRYVIGEEGHVCYVFLNGEFWGAYNLEEKVSECYIHNHYGLDEEDVCIVKKNAYNARSLDHSERKDSDEWDEFEQFVVNNDMKDEENYNRVCETIDMDNFIDFICVQVYSGNRDWWTNNNAIWKSRTVNPDNPYADGKWRWILYDLDSCAGLYNALPYDTDDIQNALDRSAFLTSLWANPDFRLRFSEHFTDIANNDFDYEKVKRTLDKMTAVYKTPVVLSEQRFRGDYCIPELGSEYNGHYDETNFETEVSTIDEYFKNRKDCIMKYLELHMGTDN